VPVGAFFGFLVVVLEVTLGSILARSPFLSGVRRESQDKGDDRNSQT